MKQGWQGSGRFKFWTDADKFIVHFNHLTTRTSKFQDDIGAFFRKEAKQVRPVYEPFFVQIWIEHVDTDPRIDVDNVAKACLDCLTKVVWFDDRQVKKLLVEKYQGETDQVYMMAKALKQVPDASYLSEVLKGLEE